MRSPATTSTSRCYGASGFGRSCPCRSSRATRQSVRSRFSRAPRDACTATTTSSSRPSWRGGRRAPSRTRASTAIPSGSGPPRASARHRRRARAGRRAVDCDPADHRDDLLEPRLGCRRGLAGRRWRDALRRVLDRGRYRCSPSSPRLTRSGRAGRGRRHSRPDLGHRRAGVDRGPGGGLVPPRGDAAVGAGLPLVRIPAAVGRRADRSRRVRGREPRPVDESCWPRFPRSGHRSASSSSASAPSTSARRSSTTLRKLERSRRPRSRTSRSATSSAMLGRSRSPVEAETAAILLVDEGGELRRCGRPGLGGEVERAEPVPLGEGLAGRVAASRQAAVIDDLERRRAREPDAPGARSPVARRDPADRGGPRDRRRARRLHARRALLA